MFCLLVLTFWVLIKERWKDRQVKEQYNSLYISFDQGFTQPAKTNASLYEGVLYCCAAQAPDEHTT